MAEMVEVTKQRTLVNPGRRRRRRMSMADKAAFVRRMKRARNAKRRKNAGPYSLRKTKKRRKRQVAYQASLYSRRRNTKRRRKNSFFGGIRKRLKKYTKRRKRNVSHIMTIYPGMNPGRRRRKTNRRRRKNTRKVVIVNMARRRRRHNARRRNYRRRRRNVVYRRRIKRGLYQYSSNPRRRRRRHNRVHYRRRRNPFGMSAGGGLFTKVIGVIGGMAVTKFASGLIPASFATGPMSYIATAVVAVAQGKIIGKVSRNPTLGNDMVVGGLALVAAKILNDYFPSIGAMTGISGLGLIGGSSFYVPQVNLSGNMGAFVVPQAVMGAIPAPTANVGATGTLGRLRRTGRLM